MNAALMIARAVGLGLLLVAVAAGQSMSGVYSATSSGAKYTLNLSESSDGALTGTLSSSAGLKVSLAGTVEEGEASGTGQGGGEQYYFEAELDGGSLPFMLVGADEEGMPDFENASELVFSRQGGKPKVEAPPKAEPEEVDETPASAEKQLAPAGGSEASDPGWGFSFPLPKGWKQRKTGEGAILGHDEIAGMILVLPHSMRSLNDVRAQMQEGLEDEDGQLAPSGEIKSMGENLLTGEYTGFYQGEQVKATGIGTLSPHGGGAYLIAVATPEKFSSGLSSAAKTVAKSMRYKKAAASAVPSYFVGTWVNTTTNTETRMTFRPDGTFSEYGEASYSGSSNDQYGNQDMAWGTANDNTSSGRWSARGTRERGVIIITYQGGKQREVQYQVHVEKGETYWGEYFFAGDLYGKQ